MQINKLLVIAICVFLGTGCSRVRMAIYDKYERQEFTKDTKDAFVHSETGKEMALKSSILQSAEKCIGTRYKYGSTDPRQGLDCSGLVYHVAQKHLIDLPRSSSTLAAAAPHISWKKSKPGDLVFFGDRGRINHVGIVEKNRANELWIIHSTTRRGVLRENVLVSPYWKKKLLFAVDFATLQPVKVYVRS